VVAINLFARCRREGKVTLIGDNGYARAQFTEEVGGLDATMLRPGA